MVNNAGDRVGIFRRVKIGMTSGTKKMEVKAWTRGTSMVRWVET